MSKVAQKHVVPSMSGGWAVRNSGSIRASRVFDTQTEAVEFGRKAAKRKPPNFLFIDAMVLFSLGVHMEMTHFHLEIKNKSDQQV